MLLEEVCQTERVLAYSIIANLFLSVFFLVSINMLKKGFGVSQPAESKRNERGKMCDFSKTEKDEGIGFTAIYSKNGFVYSPINGETN